MAKIKNPLTYMGGGSPTPPTPQPLDPEQVYRDTRPADWLVMPEPQANEVYLLLQIDASTIDDQLAYVQITQPSGSTASMEFGTTDAQGNFTADPTYTVTSTNVSANLESTVPASVYGNTTSTGMKQLMCKVSSTGELKRVWDNNSNVRAFFKRVVEISSNASLVSNGFGMSEIANPLGSGALTYAYFKGITHTNAVSVFMGCRSLIAVRKFEAPNSTKYDGLFNGCTSLRAIPQLSTSNATSFSSMFQNCRSIEAIPQFDTSHGTNFTSMFYGCSSLQAIPQIDTSSGTIFTTMFYECHNLTTIPQLATSHGTDFSSMFAYCSSLKDVPLLDTSSGTNFAGMFQHCYALTTIPQLDTSHGTNLSSMFYFCYDLKSIPQLNTSSGTNFSSMFSNCYSLQSIPQLNTSSGTNFSSMFGGCSALKTVPQLDTSSGTNFGNMFNNCYSLSEIPQLNTSSGTGFGNMFQNCYSLSYMDFTGYDFSHVANGVASLSGMLTNMCGDNQTIDFGSSWPTGGLTGSATMMSIQTQMNYSPLKVRINKTDSMLQIAMNASVMFNHTNIYVYVPDALLATYQADTYWATLGARLKAMSEWSA